jgi:hypothetical protein
MSVLKLVALSWNREKGYIWMAVKQPKY